MSRWIQRLASSDHLERVRCGEELLDLVRSDPTSATNILEVALESSLPNAISEAARVVALAGVTSLAGALRAVASDHRAAGRGRKAAALALGKLRDSESAHALRGILTHENPMYRRAAVEALGRIGTAEVSADLVAALSDSAWQVRMYAAIGLGGGQGDLRRAGYGLLEALRGEEHGPTSEQMARSLADIGGVTTELRAEICDLFIFLLEGRNHHHIALLRAAARGLGELLCIHARDVLGESARSDLAPLAEQAEWALRRIGNRGRWQGSSEDTCGS